MPIQSFYHSTSGGFDFLGLRKGSSGRTEIVYDDGVKRRLILRVAGEVSDSVIGEALRHAAAQVRVLPALYSELKKRAIRVDAVIA